MIQDVSQAQPKPELVEQLLEAGARIRSEHTDEHQALIAQAVRRLLAQLLAYLPEADCLKILDAFNCAEDAHLGMMRKTGEPYITHPVAVATMCATWKLDAQSIKAALMHDVLEDTHVTKDELTTRFSPAVANLVDGLSKLDKFEFDSREEQQAESFRKMLIAMAQDARVILVKLADRHHNLSTMETMAWDKRRRVSRETQDIYAPIALLLGLDEIARQLFDWCLYHLHPWRHRILTAALTQRHNDNREMFSKAIEQVHARFDEAGLTASIKGREKNVSSVYQKMRSKRLSLNNVMDIQGFRVILQQRSECYLALGILHELFKYVPGHFKDHISVPKPNGYQSLHTTVLTRRGVPFEFQIRTQEMDRTAEFGIAAHGLYKDPNTNFSEVQKRTHLNLQSLLHIQQNTNDSIEFLEHIKLDLSPDAIYVFTPKSKIVSLPRLATALDFAYLIHTDVGTHAVSARVNDQVVSLEAELKSGDRVEIITDAASFPNPEWLKWVRTGKARTELRQYFRHQHLSESVELGGQLLELAIRNLDLPYPSSKEDWQMLLGDVGFTNRDELLADMGLGLRHANIIAQRWLVLTAPQGADDDNSFKHALLHTSAQAWKKTKEHRLRIRGDERNTLTLSKCCCPIHGDPIVGYLQRRQGLIVHTADCAVARRQRGSDQQRWIDLEWMEHDATTTPLTVAIRIMATNERGLLAQFASKIAETGSNISSVEMVTGGEEAEINFTIEVNDRVHLARVFKAVRVLPALKKIQRLMHHA